MTTPPGTPLWACGHAWCGVTRKSCTPHEAGSTTEDGRREHALPKTWTNIERAVFFLREEKKGVLVNGPAAQFHASGFPGQTGHLQSSRVVAAPDPDGSSDRYTEILWIFRISSHQLSWTWCTCDLVDMDQLVYRHEVSNFNLVFLSNSSSNFNSI